MIANDWLPEKKAMMALVGVVWIFCVRGRLNPCLVDEMMGLARQGWVSGETSQVRRWLTLGMGSEESVKCFGSCGIGKVRTGWKT
ncbi:hypothetical protein QBC32DRAFT_345106 [Pseudoneurospora amorphoporcata]|uniref:Uncharacterized protein n=1 Tax=Pseudoneurospora amorphoporcata TaxID=241081 RepID=A0AAN6NS24_9PEZI|nr:hypothetical protein QBC32DRAFT_345106 [Pseudoneurospora amorphoporcata]